MSRFLKVLTMLLLVGAAAFPAAAEAHGHGGTRVFLGFNFGYPAYPAYYYPPPVYYVPPPPVVYYYPPPPVYYQAPAPSNCRTYRGDATIDSSGQPFYGTACLGADGRWHIVQ